MANPLIEVQKCGQSIWMDYIKRSLITSGELERLVADGIMGMTSNPTIFAKAIGDSEEYDEAISALLDRDVLEIYEALAIADIQAAADVLRPVYERTQGEDGYVSLEVSPFLAYDTQQTLSEARRLFQAVTVPNRDDQNPRHAPGSACHRGSHRGRGERQRDVAVFRPQLH